MPITKVENGHFRNFLGDKAKIQRHSSQFRLKSSQEIAKKQSALVILINDKIIKYNTFVSIFERAETKKQNMGVTVTFMKECKMKISSLLFSAPTERKNSLKHEALPA